MATLEEQIQYLIAEHASCPYDSQAKMLESILKTLLLHQQEVMGKGNEVYNQFMGAYFAFFRKVNNGIEPNITAAQGKALKEIIKYLRRQSHSKDDAGALASWEFILSNWHKLTKFIQQQNSLTQIYKYINEIITQLKNGHYDKSATRDQERDAIKSLDDALGSFIEGRS